MLVKMININNCLGRAALFLAFGGIAACGGGGGESGGGGGGTGSFTLSTTHLTAQATLGGPSAQPQKVIGTASGIIGNVYIVVAYTNTGLYSVDANLTGPNTGEINVAFRNNGTEITSGVGPGHYQDTITVKLCRDPACNTVIGGGPKTITVDYDVNEGGAFQTSAPAIQNSVIQGVRPDPQNLTLSYSGGGVKNYSATVSYQEGSGWLSVAPSARTVSSLPATLVINESLLPIGTYRATINIVSNGGTVSAAVPVTYTVLPPRSSPSAFNLTIDLNTPLSALQATVGLLPNFNDSNAASVNFTVNTDAPWLTVTPSSGSTSSSGPFQVSISPVALKNLPYGAQVGNIVFTPTAPGVAPLKVPVYLTIALPRVEWAVPHVVAAGQSQTSILRGHGFTGLTSQAINVGDQTVSSYSVVSDTEIHLTAPALPAGNQPVNVVDQFGGNPNLSHFAYVTPIPEASYAMDAPAVNPIGTQDTVFDEERRALYVLANPSYIASSPDTTERLQRYQFNGVRWVLSLISLPGYISRIFLTPDNQELIAVTRQAILHINPDTLVINASVPIEDPEQYNFGDVFGVFNNGTLFVLVDPLPSNNSPNPERARAYDLRTHLFIHLNSQAQYQVLDQADHSVVTRLGNRLLIGGNLIAPDTGRLMLSMTSDFNVEALEKNPDTRAYILAASDDGSRFYDNVNEVHQVVGASIIHAGNLNVPDGSPARAPYTSGSRFTPVALSQDGTRLFIEYSALSSAEDLYRFDLTQPPLYPWQAKIEQALPVGYGFFLGASGSTIYATGTPEAFGATPTFVVTHVP